MSSVYCQSCGHAIDEATTFCPNCGAKQPAQVTIHSTAQTQSQLHADVKGWSWGAFLLNAFWAIGNKVWIGLLCFIPIINLPVAILLGIKGREWAWKANKWESIEHFNRVQRKWSIWGFVIAGVLTALYVVVGIVMVRQATHQFDTNPLSQDTTPQLFASAASDVASQPTPAVSVAQNAPANRGTLDSQAITIDSYAESFPSSIPTAAGTFTYQAETANAPGQVALNGRPLFTGDDAQWQHPVLAFKLSGGQTAILMTSTGGRGTSCESLFYFLIASAENVSYTPEFGTCASTGTLEQDGDKIKITLPKMGGTSTYVFNGQMVTEDGKTIQMTDDVNPSK